MMIIQNTWRRRRQWRRWWGTRRSSRKEKNHFKQVILRKSKWYRSQHKLLFTYLVFIFSSTCYGITITCDSFLRKKKLNKKTKYEKEIMFAYLTAHSLCLRKMLQKKSLHPKQNLRQIMMVPIIWDYFRHFR